MSVQPFLKYPEIEDFDRTKYIEKFLAEFPDLSQQRFILQEKINGANIAFIYTPKQPIQYASRERIITKGPDFFQYTTTLEKERFLIFNSHVQEIVDNFKAPLTLYGEYFGRNEKNKSIAKGVEYGPAGGRDILFFDMRVASNPLSSQADFYHFVKDYDIKDYMVPTVSTVKSLEKALAFDTNFESVLYRLDGNIAEGVVIKPIERQYIINMYGSDNYFYLKKKNAKFRVAPSQKATTPKVETKVNGQFLAYVNEERANNIESHEGHIQQKSQLGAYIKALLNDAEKDFRKDFPGASDDDIRGAKKTAAKVALQIFMKRC